MLPADRGQSSQRGVADVGRTGSGAHGGPPRDESLGLFAIVAEQNADHSRGDRGDRDLNLRVVQHLRDRRRVRRRGTGCARLAVDRSQRAAPAAGRRGCHGGADADHLRGARARSAKPTRVAGPFPQPGSGAVRGSGSGSPFRSSTSRFSCVPSRGCCAYATATPRTAGCWSTTLGATGGSISSSPVRIPNWRCSSGSIRRCWRSDLALTGSVSFSARAPGPEPGQEISRALTLTALDGRAQRRDPGDDAAVDQRPGRGSPGQARGRPQPGPRAQHHVGHGAAGGRQPGRDRVGPPTAAGERSRAGRAGDAGRSRCSTCRRAGPRRPRSASRPRCPMLGPKLRARHGGRPRRAAHRYRHRDVQPGRERVADGHAWRSGSNPPWCARRTPTVPPSASCWTTAREDRRSGSSCRAAIPRQPCASPSRPPVVDLEPGQTRQVTVSNSTPGARRPVRSRRDSSPSSPATASRSVEASGSLVQASSRAADRAAEHAAGPERAAPVERAARAGHGRAGQPPRSPAGAASRCEVTIRRTSCGSPSTRR